MLWRRFPDCSERNAGIESDELSSMLNRESKKVCVRQLPRSMDSGAIDYLPIQQTDGI
jgi:hypothetical protein